MSHGTVYMHQKQCMNLYMYVPSAAKAWTSEKLRTLEFGHTTALTHRVIKLGIVVPMLQRASTFQKKSIAGLCYL